MKTRVALSMVTIAALFARPSAALADGGSLQLSQRVGKHQISVFTSPAAPRVGQIDFSVLVQDADTGNIGSSVPINIAMEDIDAPAIPLIEVATASATNKLFQSATFEVPQAGTWRVKVEFAESTSNGIQFDLAVSPPLPPWLTLMPWIAWPMVVIAVFLIHQRLKIWHSRRRKTGRISGTFATMRTELRGPNRLILDAAARHD